jgi:hypothetical protein
MYCCDFRHVFTFPVTVPTLRSLPRFLAASGGTPVSTVPDATKGAVQPCHTALSNVHTSTGNARSRSAMGLQRWSCRRRRRLAAATAGLAARRMASSTFPGGTVSSSSSSRPPWCRATLHGCCRRRCTHASGAAGLAASSGGGDSSQQSAAADGRPRTARAAVPTRSQPAGRHARHGK